MAYDEKPRLVHRLDKDTSGVLAACSHARGGQGPDRRHPAQARRARSTGRWWQAFRRPTWARSRYGLVKASGARASGRRGGKDAVPSTRATSSAYRGCKTCTHACMQRFTGWRDVPPGSRWSRSPAAPISCGRIWPRSGIRSSAMANTAAPGQENLGDGWGAQLGGVISRKLHLHARSMALPEHPGHGQAS